MELLGGCFVINGLPRPVYIQNKLECREAKHWPIWPCPIKLSGIGQHQYLHNLCKLLTSNRQKVKYYIFYTKKLYNHYLAVDCSLQVGLSVCHPAPETQETNSFRKTMAIKKVLNLFGNEYD